jgi:hypothetical protein
MTVELNAWQVTVIEQLVERELKKFEDCKERPYPRSLGGLLNVLSLAKVRHYGS